MDCCVRQVKKEWPRTLPMTPDKVNRLFADPVCHVGDLIHRLRASVDGHVIVTVPAEQEVRSGLWVKVVVHSTEEPGEVIEAPTTWMVDRLKVPRSDRPCVVPLSNTAGGIPQTLKILSYRAFIFR